MAAASHVLYAMYSPPPSTTALPAMRRPSGGSISRKPLPSLPSPTLTNPDMVLPNERGDVPAVPSPPRGELRDRPPSPTYLREQASAPQLRDVGGSNGGSMSLATPMREKRGLMSRKMMLLRSRTASNNSQIPRSAPSERNSEEQDSVYASSPTLMDVGNLLPEPIQQERRPSAGADSFNDEDLSDMTQFLARYSNKDATASDGESENASPTPQKYGYSVSVEGGLEEKRRKQEEDEQNSAILSKRAEAILANAKKRLNLMEGNLRGARDLVAPLTAANLKRATSVSSSHVTSASIYGSRSRPIYDGYHYDTGSSRQPRNLQAQASSPTMGREFRQGHWRGFSETEVPERPYTAMERTTLGRTNSPVRPVGRFPVKAQDSPLAGNLRGSRSYDSLGGHVRMNDMREHTPYRGSPDSNLEPLVEDEDGLRFDFDGSTPQKSGSQSGSDLGRPSSRTDGLRDQMTSLRGRISSLKETAREDSLRRQSMQNLREPSPLNNAAATPPEFFYTQAPSYGSPVLDTNAGIGTTSQNNSPIALQTGSPSHGFTGSKNAFAEQAQRPRRESAEGKRASPDQTQRPGSRTVKAPRPHASTHHRTPSGTTIVEASKHRYSHHQPRKSSSMPGAYTESPSDLEQDESQKGLGIGINGNGDYDDQSDAGASDYQDAESESTPSVVAHEDREDAFDYKHFFLHSAMGTYGIGNDSAHSVSSDESVSSIETARGPTAMDDEISHDFNPGGIFPPPTPETPDRLREIERSLHRRTYSVDSVSTVATFATATEGHESPEPEDVFPREWPLSPQTHSAPSSRPHTAIPTKHTEHRSDSSSDRADSGVGLNSSKLEKASRHRHHPSAPASILHGPSPTQPVSATFSPPSMSSRGLQNPASVVVNALVEPRGKPLGLKDKALLFSVVEQLRAVCKGLQEDGEGGGDAKAMRRRLEEAKKVLGGGVEGKSRSK